MTKNQIINLFIKKYKYKRYLEIGIFDGWNFNLINCENKDAVDPGAEGILAGCVNYPVTSDEFFSIIKNKKEKYDFIFIDGLHHTEQVDKDIENSLNHLSENGVIMLHDANPSSFELQEIPRKNNLWTGDVWKSVVKIKYNNPEINYFTVDTDFGCAILKKGYRPLKNKVSLEKALQWSYFEVNKGELLNLISPEVFMESFKIL